jgi:hypothetical protein
MHITQAAESLLLDVLRAAPALSGVTVRRRIDDEPKTRPIVTISGSEREALIPDGLYSVAQVDLKVDIETQFEQSTVAEHDNLITAVYSSIPEIGQFTGAQAYFEKVYFGATHEAGDLQNDLVRIYSLRTYIVGRLTIPTG